MSSLNNLSASRPPSPWWLLLGIALLLFNLGYAPLWNPDEGRYGAASLEMTQPFDGRKPDWIVPHLNTVPRLNKPPLVYWTTAASFQMLGVSEFAARLPSALAAVGVLLLLWQFGRHMYGARAGVLAGLVWATSALPFILSHTLNTDMLLTFSITLAAFGLWLMSQCKPGGHSNRISWLVAGVLAGSGLGFAMLAKGPVGVVLPIGIWGLWLIVTRRMKFLSGIHLGATIVAFLIALLISAPWYIAIAREHPEFLYTFLFGENIARLTGQEFYHEPKPFYFYVPVVLIGLFPWPAFLIPAIARLHGAASKEIPAQTTQQSALTDQQNRWFLWIWAGAIVVLFSISSVKLVTYVLPAFPALALLLAETLTSFFARRESSARAMAWAVRLTIALFVLLGLALPIAFLNDKLLGNKVTPTSEIIPYVWAFALVSLVSAVLLMRKYSCGPAPVIVGGATAIFAILLTAAGTVARYEDSSAMLIALKSKLKPGDVVVQFKSFDPTAIFYLNRPLQFINVENRSGWDDETFDNSPLFVQEHSAIQQALTQARKQKGRVFILTKWKHRHFPAVKAIPQIAQTNDYRILTNQPMATDFNFEAIAPRKRARELSPECKALSPLC